MPKLCVSVNITLVVPNDSDAIVREAARKKLAILAANPERFDDEATVEVFDEMEED